MPELPPLMRQATRTFAIGLVLAGVSSCGDPFFPFRMGGGFVMEGGVEVPVAGAPATAWLVADTLYFYTDGTGEQRGTIESRSGTVTRSSVSSGFRYERLGSRLSVSWFAPSCPPCNVAIVQDTYVVDGDVLRARIAAVDVSYRRVGSLRAP